MLGTRLARGIVLKPGQRGGFFHRLGFSESLVLVQNFSIYPLLPAPRCGVRAGVLLAAAFGTALTMAPHAWASTAAINVSTTQAGVTPQYLGYNMGHYLPGSNTSAWVDYSGVNAFRVWTSPSDYEPTDDVAPFGDGVSDLPSFNARKSALRADPQNPAYIDFSKFDDHFTNDVQSGRNKVVADTILSDLQARGITPVIELSRSTAWTMNTWAGKWEQWQHVYAMAYYMGSNYDVSRFQTYNEPDQTTSPVPMGEWLDRLRIASDAIRSAVADVNRDYGKTLVADVSAPVTISGASKIDTWGKAALEANRTDYQGQTVDYDIFNTYDAHRYNSTGAAFAQDMQTYQTKVPEYNASGEMMPVTYTEHNRRNSSSFAGSTDTLDTPSMFTGLADNYIGAIQNGVAGMYAFKFSQTLWDHDSSSETPDVSQKTGFHYVNHDYDEGGTNDITGATRGAGVVRLAAKGLKGARPRLAADVTTSNANFKAVTSYDPESGNYYIFSVNQNVTTGYDLTIDFRDWDVEPGTFISVEEVSPARHGEVTRLQAVPETGVLAVSQPQESVWLMTIPRGAVRQRVTLAATADARVRNSDAASSQVYADNNYGSLTTALVGRTPDSARLDYATYVKFDVSAYEADDLSQAIFQITGRSTNLSAGDPGPLMFHVYALADDSWSEGGITWNNAPNLADLDSQATGVAVSAFPVGHLTFDGDFAESGIDLTDFLRLRPELFDDGSLSLALVREERFAGDADPSLSYVELKTKEGGAAPKLTLSLKPPTTGDFDDDGDTDGADFLAWQRAVESTSVAEPADGNLDARVDGADLQIWRDQFGSGNAGAVQAAVPEANAWVLVTLAALSAWFRRDRFPNRHRRSV